MTSVNPGNEVVQSQGEPAQNGVEVEYADPNQQAIADVVGQLEHFKVTSREANSSELITQRLADTQTLQGEGMAVDPDRFITGFDNHFAVVSSSAELTGRSAFMDELLPTDGSQTAHMTRYNLGGGVSVQADVMSRVADGKPTWVRVTATRHKRA
jgi:hypothetical protein